MSRLFLIAVIFHSHLGFSAEMAAVPGGRFRPLFGGKKEVEVKHFLIDEAPVTNQDFLEFVKKDSKWSRGRVPSLFADLKYLKHWKAPRNIGSSRILKSPVVNVSWFAAKAYCESKGKHLPSVGEWEFLAQFGPEKEGADVKAIILEWYSKPTPPELPNVRSTFRNKFGVWDVHGLIWEWTDDFNSTFITGESRGDSALEKSMFCGSGALGSADPSNYAAFMRFGFRSSLKGSYTVENLGFRCVKGNAL